MYAFKLIVEAFVVGIMTVIFGSLIAMLLVTVYPKNDLPEVCASYNKYRIMEATLFLTGFVIHLVCEATGINAWYLKNSAAALKLSLT